MIFRIVKIWLTSVLLRESWRLQGPIYFCTSCVHRSKASFRSKPRSQYANNHAKPIIKILLTSALLREPLKLQGPIYFCTGCVHGRKDPFGIKPRSQYANNNANQQVATTQISIFFQIQSWSLLYTFYCYCLKRLVSFSWSRDRYWDIVTHTASGHKKIRLED